MSVNNTAEVNMFIRHEENLFLPHPVIDRRTFIRWSLMAPFISTLAACSEGETTAGWVLEPHNPVLGGTLGVCFDPAVLKDEQLYRMWFSWRTQHSIGYTESRNGYEWSTPKIVLKIDPTISGQI